uniref:Uncharacterized protein n=1 Tax=Accipiter nisus TaxID=211598 RepID=A0A8B9M8Q0_9AVES
MPSWAERWLPVTVCTGTGLQRDESAPGNRSAPGAGRHRGGGLTCTGMSLHRETSLHRWVCIGDRTVISPVIPQSQSPTRVCGPVHVCVCVCIPVHNYTCACRCVHLYMCVHVYAYVSVCTGTHSCVCAGTHTSVYVCMQPCTHVCMCVYAGTCACVCVQTHVSACRHVCSHVHTCSCTAACTHICAAIHPPVQLYLHTCLCKHVHDFTPNPCIFVHPHLSHSHCLLTAGRNACRALISTALPMAANGCQTLGGTVGHPRVTAEQRGAMSGHLGQHLGTLGIQQCIDPVKQPG